MNHTLPLGVVEAENKRDARILAEHLRGERQVLMEQHRLHLYFVAPSWTVGEIVKVAEEYRTLGFQVALKGVVDAKGDTYGLELTGDLR
jgi:hypothetical protein